MPTDGTPLLPWADAERIARATITRAYYLAANGVASGAFDREDLLQQAMLGIWQAAGCPSDPDGLRLDPPEIATIAYRRMIDALRAWQIGHPDAGNPCRPQPISLDRARGAGPGHDADAGSPAAALTDPRDIVSWREDLADIARAAASLTPRQREALMLMAREHGATEIAHAMGVSVARADQYVRLVRTKLRSALN